MPELPEVEQVRISLLPHIVGKTIEKVRVDLPKMILHPDPDAFVRRLQGARFTGVRRRGKYLGLELEGGDWLLVHLRMTGALLALPKNLPAPLAKLPMPTVLERIRKGPSPISSRPRSCRPAPSTKNTLPSCRWSSPMP